MGEPELRRVDANKAQGLTFLDTRLIKFNAPPNGGAAAINEPMLTALLSKVPEGSTAYHATSS